MRYIKPENALSFVSLGQKVSLKSNVENSRKLIEEMRDTYRLLVEVRHGIYDLSEIVDEDGIVSFTIIEGEQYSAYHETLSRDLVWDTAYNAPDLKQSEIRWRELLCRGAVRKSLVDGMRANVVQEPSLEDFGSDLVLYLLHCEREDDWYSPTAEVIKISGMAGE